MNAATDGNVTRRLLNRMATGSTQRSLDWMKESRYSVRMTRLFDMDDRARLRERFFGATHTVLASL
ncbi:MAG: hypothetical protein ABJX32_04130 [Tateyamaria sp.]|uniref:hypothetical protein n=1 Tax=Tateyamaria sp. TaxID=1929288 RepID=UPI00329EDF26